MMRARRKYWPAAKHAPMLPDPASMSYEIKTHGPIGPKLQNLARAKIHRIIVALRTLNASTLDVLTHDLRKRLKRLRALLWLVREPLGKKRYRAEDGVFREAGRALAAMRDAQALLKTHDRLQQQFFPRKPPAMLRVMRQKFSAHERQCVSALVGSAALEKQIVGLQAALNRVADWPVEDYGWKELRRAAKRSYQRSRESCEQARDAPDPAHLHRWRKRTKDFSLYLRLLRRIGPVLMEELAHDYEVLGEFLGDDHDLVVLRAAVEKQRDTILHRPARTAFLQLLDLRREELRAAAFALGERLHADSPTVFARGLGEHRAASRQRTRETRKRTRQLNAARRSPGQQRTKHVGA